MLRKKATALLAAFAVAGCQSGLLLYSQESSRERVSEGNITSPGVYLPFAQFQIPFDVDSSGTPPAAFQLLVSTDDGATWQMHGRASARDRHFDFRAAAEGEYLFKVQSLDASGLVFPSPDRPLRVRVDSSRPQASLRADLDHQGSLIIDLRVFDEHLDLSTALIRLRTDRDTQWREVPVTTLSRIGQSYEGQLEVLIPSCREVAIVFTIADLAKNVGEASLLYSVPRTAANSKEMQLASTGTAVESSRTGSETAGVNFPGAVIWDSPHDRAGQFTQQVNAAKQGVAIAKSTAEAELAGGQASPKSLAWPQAASSTSNQSGNFPTSPRIIQANQQPIGPGKFAKNVLELELSPPVQPLLEELGLPDALPERPENTGSTAPRPETRSPAIDNVNPPAAPEALSENRLDLPYYCRSRTFSLDYSVEALGGNTLSEVELWGSEDHGRSWQKWGSDPDRSSPFDVKVGNDGLFGFRMVLVGAGGTVLGHPKPGEDADAWIQIDTSQPNCKITRAVYGVGSEAGMLVIDYTCTDDALSEQAISLWWSASPEGPWTPVANGLKNTGLYLWKADAGLPNRAYLKLDAVDKAGNIGTHRLDLPIDTKGLTPRGRIQGIRPIVAPQ